MKSTVFKFIAFIFLGQTLISSVFGISARFTYSRHNNCAPAIVEFENNSTQGNGISYKWNFGLGAVVTTIDRSTKTQVYLKPGQYRVSLVVTDGINTDSTFTMVSIGQGPMAKISADPVSGCAPLNVNYTSISVKGDSDIVSADWDLRNGKYLAGNTVQYTYSKTGRYSIALKVTDKNGCADVVESDSIIQVVSKPKIAFSTADTFGCTPPLNASFVNTSSGASDLTYRWDFGNGQTATDVSKSVIYNDAGSFAVKLVATDQSGCTDSLIRKSYINVGNPPGTLSVFDKNNNLITNSTLCSGTYKFVFSVANLPDYTWIIRDNNKVSVIKSNHTLEYSVKDTGKLEVNIIYGRTDFCTDNFHTAFLKSSLKADFQLDNSILCGLPYQVNLTSKAANAVKYSWKLFDHVISGKADTSYLLTLKDLPDELYKNNYSHQADTVHVPFSLIVTNQEGCSDVINHSLSFSFPVARFMPDKVSGCAPLLVSFADSSKSASPIDEFKYIIGTDTLKSATKAGIKYTFTKPGEYYIREIIKSAGCTDTSYVVKVVAGKKLKIAFSVTPAEVCNGGQIRVAASSENNDLVQMWRFKSGNLLDISSKTKIDSTITVYSDTLGNKKISLQTDYNGCKSDTTINAAFKIIGPAGNFSESFSCDSALVYHFKSAIKPATSLVWEADTSTIVNMDSIRYKFPKSGNYTVKLTATDDATHCILSKTKLVQVRQIKADFALNDSVFCVGDSVKMNAYFSRDYIKSCFNEGFLWDYGDDSPPRRSFSPSNSYIYSSKGNFKLRMFVFADNGCVDSLRKNVFVYRPEGSFISDKKEGCLPSLEVSFKNTSTDSTIVKTIWDFGDKVTDQSGIVMVKHTYTGNQAKTFVAALSVYDAHQCYSTSTIPITLKGVNAEFQADDNAFCAGRTIRFTPVNSELDSVLWDFGDGHTSKHDNSNLYNTIGRYPVSLTAYQEGCSNTLTKPAYVSVERADAQFFVNDSIFNCYPDTLIARHKNLNGSPVVSRVWTFDSNELFNTKDSVSYIYNLPGTYSAQLAIRTLNGCQSESSKVIKVIGPTGSASFSPKKICYNEMVNFTVDSSKNTGSYKWIFGDGNTSTTAPVSHAYMASGYIVPSLQLINNKCIITKILDTLFVSPQMPDFIRVPSGDTTIHYGDSIRLKILTNTQEYAYSWSPDYNISCRNCNQPWVLPLRDAVYTVDLKNQCYDVSENFTIKVTADYYLEAPDAFTPNGDGTNDIFKFETKNLSKFDLKIFNRWGNIVFSSQDTHEGWDGKVNGKLQNTDTYTYFIKAETITGNSIEKHGNFLLLH